LNTLDLDVLEATLRLLHRPAHRSNAQKSPRFTTLIKSNRILPFIEAWGPKDAGFQMSRFLSESNIAISSILYKFYRLKKDEGSSAADLISQNTEGLVIIPIHLHLSGYKSDADILNDLVAKFSVPVEHHLSLFQHIRLASAVANENLRLKLLRIRLLAITLYGILRRFF
jgi:E3 ubiquitin-protein ligase HUWE1